MSGDLLLLSGAPPVPTHADLVNVRAGFCNQRDSHGRVIFEPFLCSLDGAGRREWLSHQAAQGYTHFTLSPEYSYNSATPYPIPGKNMLDKPEEFAGYVSEVCRTPAADGKGWRVIVMMDGGAPDPRPRIDRYWRPIFDALKPWHSQIIFTAGWELIAASSWSSADYSYALQRMRPWLGDDVEMWAHLSSDRAAFSSNPVQSDDPWQGEESGCWTSHGGEFLSGLFYQSQPLQNRDNPHCDPLDASCFLNRWEDVVPRLGLGMNGWRVVNLCFYESVAYYYFQGLATSDYARDVATSAKKLADKYGVPCGFGNGVPW